MSKIHECSSDVNPRLAQNSRPIHDCRASTITKPISTMTLERRQSPHQTASNRRLCAATRGAGDGNFSESRNARSTWPVEIFTFAGQESVWCRITSRRRSRRTRRGPCGRCPTCRRRAGLGWRWRSGRRDLRPRSCRHRCRPGRSARHAAQVTQNGHQIAGLQEHSQQHLLVASWFCALGVAKVHHTRSQQH